MDNQEAISLLERELDSFRQESYADLVRRIGQGPVVREQQGSKGTLILEIEFLWDGPVGGDVRVLGSVDDGGWRAFVPITRSFIKSADGSFVGE
jgi:hypothetical protein